MDRSLAYGVGVAVTVSDSDIVPDEVQNVLMFWRDTFRRGYFNIGDIANELVRRSAVQGMPVADVRVFEAVGRFCGRSGRTVRYYAETAAFYREGEREEYDMLPFSHFVFARSLGERWREVLEFAKANPSISLSALQMAFIAPGIQEDAKRVEGDLPGGDIEDIGDRGVQTVEPRAEAQGRGFQFGIVSRVSQIVEGITYLYDRSGDLGLDEATSERLRSALRELRDVIPAIVRSLREGSRV